ncbi:hypothetical protein BJY01DRAFT_141252 [Aspergillus pseudoustus]|uniref:Uncharacterized protein n=1 Tax=Aspergillus pseudoustus TaxID=1810923 RepID=A0ABR4IH86_9EURO
MQAIGAQPLGNTGQPFAVQGTRELLFQFELEARLTEWAMAEGISVNLLGNLQPVWQIMIVQDLRRVDEIQQYINRVQFDPKSEARFPPLPHTVATYLIKSMLEGSWNQATMDRMMAGIKTEERQRHKIGVIRDSFLWLGDLVEAAGAWAWMLLPISDERREREIRKKLRWLQKEDTKAFYLREASNPTLNEEERSDLEELWNLFERAKDSHLVVRCAFCLAQLGAKGSWDQWNSEGWSEYYNLVVKGLM